MSTVRSSGSSVAFVPQTMSYYYETLPCIDAVASGYSAISFAIKAPPGASLTLEIQTKESCSAPTYTSTSRFVKDFTGEIQTIVIPLSSFTGVYPSAIGAFNWGSWDSYMDKEFTWELGDIALTCGAGSNMPADVYQYRNTT
ncbi:hypothetical protein F4677DRAFT_434911 [Hypoxylon crocopeplum]|nr:hypothetical protein F4677DRAFT_434911 [Hypoxylon crocopeplum]